jgi:hypothetical protein
MPVPTFRDRMEQHHGLGARVSPSTRYHGAITGHGAAPMTGHSPVRRCDGRLRATARSPARRQGVGGLGCR